MNKGRTPKFSSAEVGRAMKEADGDYGEAAKMLGMPSARSMEERIVRDPSLRAIWQPRAKVSDEPQPTETEVQTPNPLLPDHETVRIMEENGREIYRQGIAKFLDDDPELMERFSVFKGIETNIGMMFAQTTQFFQTKLVEILCSLSKMDKSLGGRIEEANDPEEYVMLTRLRLQTYDMFGKYYDRNLSGLETLVKLTDKSEAKVKKKPGFSPLKDLKDD